MEIGLEITLNENMDRIESVTSNVTAFSNSLTNQLYS